MWKRILRTGRMALPAILVALLGALGPAGAAEYWLRAEATTLTMPDGQTVPMWGYALDADGDFATVDGTVQVPGPELSVPPGESLTIHLQNNLPEPTSIVIPGQIPDTMTPVRFADGGPLDGRIRSFTSEAAAGGGIATYTWTTFRSGTFLYQSGTHAAIQVPMGLYGAVAADAGVAEAYPGVPYDSQITLLFSEIDPAQHAAVDALYNGDPAAAYGSAAYPGTLVVGYEPKYFLVNGQSYVEGTTPAIPVAGNVLLRFLNAGLRLRMPVVAGTYFTLLAEDGNRKPFSLQQASLDLPAGMTVDALLQPTAAGRTAVYDRAQGVSTAGLTPGGMYVFLEPAVAVVVRSPNGGEVLPSGSEYAIQWTPAPGAASYALSYTVDAGTTWQPIADVGAVANYLWTVPAYTVDQTSQVQVTALDATGGLLAQDESNAPFTITPTPVQVVAPNGGESLPSGGVYSIQWTDAAALTAGYRLHYSLDGGASWTLIGEAAAGTSSFAWTVPTVAATAANSLVRVAAFDASGGSLGADISDNPFTITPPPFQLLAPNGGEPLASGTVFAVRWNPSQGAAVYALSYSLDGGSNWLSIGQVAAPATAFDWTVPAVTAEQGNTLLQVAAYDGADLLLESDQSNTPFTITPSPVQVVAPNGGEILTSGSMYSIAWSPAANATGYAIDYSLDGGATWVAIATVGASASYMWTVPPVSTSWPASLVRVTGYDAAGVRLGADASDLPFTIAPPPVRVLSPNGGETLTAGTLYTIQWTDVGVARYDLAYSLDGGATWLPIQQVTAGSSYSWTVPAVTAVQGNSFMRVRAFDAAGTLLSEDISDTPFTISPVLLRLITPNGGETLNAGIPYLVQWNGLPGAVSYRLQYSVNNGGRWTTIQQSLPGTAVSYSWTVPDIRRAQTRSLMRLTAYGPGGAVLAEDVSDGTFTLAP